MTEQYGPTKTDRVKGLRADVRVQTRDPAPSRNELPPQLVAEVRAELLLKPVNDLYKDLGCYVKICSFIISLKYRWS